MAKRKTSKKSSGTTKSKGTRTRIVRERVSSGARRAKSLGKKINWGEAILMALAGYFTGPALQDSGIANYVASELSSRSAAAGEFFYHQGNGIPGENMAKLIGAGVGAKGVYDVAKGKKNLGINAELPYAIGAILDPKSEYKGTAHANAQGARW